MKNMHPSRLEQDTEADAGARMIARKKIQSQRSKRVTLIVAARTPEGIVIHADSQDTAGAFRVQVDKIKCEKMGEFSVLIAGAGCPSSLVDAFPLRLGRRINEKVTTIAKFVSETEKELNRFYRHDIPLCPDDDKNVIYLIAVWHSKTRQYQAWVADNVVLQPIPDTIPVLLGWDHRVYLGIAKHIYSRAMNTQQTLLAGIYLLTIAEETCSYIGGPIKIAVVNEGGIQLETEDYVRRTQDRLKAYENRANKVFLACADTTVSLPALEDSINEFRQTALDLHREQIDEVAKKATLLDFARGNPFRQLPFVPMEILEKGFRVEHGREAIEKARSEQDVIDAWLKESGIEVLTKNVECVKCRKAFEASMPCGGPFDHSNLSACPNCGEGVYVEWIFKSGGFA